jgi:hypothetical protein
LINTGNRWLSRKRQKQSEVTKASARRRLMKVELAPQEPQCGPETANANAGFTIVLDKAQRRIESSWNFGDEDLARLIRIVESA